MADSKTEDKKSNYAGMVEKFEDLLERTFKNPQGKTITLTEDLTEKKEPGLLKRLETAKAAAAELAHDNGNTDKAAALSEAVNDARRWADLKKRPAYKDALVTIQRDIASSSLQAALAEVAGAANYLRNFNEPDRNGEKKTLDEEGKDKSLHEALIKLEEKSKEIADEMTDKGTKKILKPHIKALNDTLDEAIKATRKEDRVKKDVKYDRPYYREELIRIKQEFNTRANTLKAELDVDIDNNHAGFSPEAREAARKAVPAETQQAIVAMSNASKSDYNTAFDPAKFAPKTKHSI